MVRHAVLADLSNGVSAELVKAGWCFGLFLWEYMMERDDEWLCGKFDKDGVPIGGTTYFRKTS